MPATRPASSLALDVATAPSTPQRHSPVAYEGPKTGATSSPFLKTAKKNKRKVVKAYRLGIQVGSTARVTKAARSSQRGEESEGTVLNKRYRTLLPLNELTSVISPGVDLQARSPQEAKVFVKLVRSEGEYRRQIGLYQQLRSNFVAPLVDHFEGTGDLEGTYFLVLSRGTYDVLEFVETFPGVLPPEVRGVEPGSDEDDVVTRWKLLRDIASCTLYCHVNGFTLSLDECAFMYFSQSRSWKLVDLEGAFPSSLCSAEGDEEIEYDAFYVPHPVADLIVGKKHSLFRPHSNIRHQNVGMTILELLLSFDPALADITTPELYDFALLQDDGLPRPGKLPDEADEGLRALVGCLRYVLKLPSTKSKKNKVRRREEERIDLVLEGVAAAMDEGGLKKKDKKAPKIAGYLK
mmetsp:Transcript_32824/g.84785  ORF Transcript_32824/g.84785 Transcript_32824/m.84785 type:complete len:407 (-) Transcript_32824:382-1602(-)